jgi:hypothetical protein
VLNDEVYEFGFLECFGLEFLGPEADIVEEVRHGVEIAEVVDTKNCF